MRFQSRSFFTLALLIMLVAAVLLALRWPLRASILILLLGGAGAIVLGVQLYKEVFTRNPSEDQGSGMDVSAGEGQKGREASRRTMAIWAWLIVLSLGIWLIGFRAAIPIFAFLYSLLNGGRWYWSLFIGFLSFAILYGVFELVIRAPWPEPYLMQLLGR